ncbi:MAG: Macrolide export ATP-binding/permease protein MacB [Gemmatimonadaceae bacterium]|nr:Macrolide export ATP-binding/permease protein MacB [Gemmatimonadaceae bacterium]
MKRSTLFKVAIESILKNKLRTLLTMLGIVIGVGAVIVMVAVGQGARSQIAAQIASLGTNMLVITPGSSAQGGVSQGAATFNRLTISDVEKLMREGTTASLVSPVVVTRTQAIGGGTNWRTSVNGVSVDFQTIRAWPVAEGGFFTDQDVRTSRKVAVLGSTVANNLYPGEDAVGQMIQLRDVPFEIIGVLTTKGQTASGTDQDDVVIIPYTTAQTKLSGHTFISQIVVGTQSSSEIPAATDEIRAIMRESHRLAPADADDFTVRNQSDLTAAATGTTDVMSTLLASIAAISLLVGGIGIMNIMLVSVTERTREIGIRMSLGARGRDVLTQFLVESVVMSLVGGVIGILIGVAGAAILGKTMGWHTEVSTQAVMIAVAFSAAVGIFFGFHPARKASGLDPIQALRHE